LGYVGLVQLEQRLLEFLGLYAAVGLVVVEEFDKVKGRDFWGSGYHDVGA
jgi:hypothetical protein